MMPPLDLPSPVLRVLAPTRPRITSQHPVMYRMRDRRECASANQAMLEIDARSQFGFEMFSVLKSEGSKSLRSSRIDKNKKRL